MHVFNNVSDLGEIFCLVINLCQRVGRLCSLEKVKESLIITNQMSSKELRTAQNKKQQLIECKWRLELDSEANELIKWINEDVLNELDIYSCHAC